MTPCLNVILEELSEIFVKQMFAILSYHCVLYYRKSTLSEKFELDPNNMGNYKSRPQSSCSEELRKKISEFHATILKKLDFDLRVPLPNDMR